MDVQTGLIYVGVVVISAAVILLVSMFGIKEKSYEEAIAEQRKLPDDLLLGKKDKNKEKKHKNKTGKKVKEKKDEKDEKDEKEEKPEHVQFEEVPQILTSEIPTQDACKGNKKKNKPEKVKPILVNKDESPVIVFESIASQPSLNEINHFDIIHPKDEFELIHSHSKENLNQVAQSEFLINKSPKETPTKLKKNAIKEANKKKEEDNSNTNTSIIINANTGSQQFLKELNKENKELQKESTTALIQSKKNKKKLDILAQIGGDKDGVNVSLLMPLVQKAELSRSEIQILIDQLLNKQLDNPMEHSEWTEGRTDPIIKLKKQLAEKEKALAEEHEASVTFQNKLKELRSEWNAERSRLTNNLKQLEEAHNNKLTEAQTLHTRMQHILETHAAEKQGLLRQREQLQAKINEDAAIIHKMQEDKGQSQGHLQQELVAQRKQLEVQFAQMRDNENGLKAQLAQKHVELQELQNVNISMTQELQATCESSTAEIEMLRQQLSIIQDQFMHSEGQLQHYKEANDRYQDMARQLEESHRSQNDLDHRLKQSHRHEQELQKQIHSQQNELKLVKTDAQTLNNELNKVQNELIKLKSDLSQSQNETNEINNLKTLLSNKDDELKKSNNDSNKLQSEIQKLELTLNDTRNELNCVRDKLNEASDYINNVNQTNNELELVKAQLEKVKNNEKINSNEIHLKIIKLQEENDRLSIQLKNLPELEKQLKKLTDENELLSIKLAGITEKTRENGIDDEIEKKNNLLIDNLQTELNNKQTEYNQLVFQFDTLRNDFNNQSEINKRLQSDLEAQRAKNNELRSRNWKVMEALSNAESRIKSASNNVNDNIDNTKKTEQDSTKTFLMRLFPDIKISEKSYDKWLISFEQHANLILNDMRNQIEDLDKQNQNLQRVVAHYKQIINETEGMLNNLQHHVESAESRWQSELRQKENENVSLQLELNQLKTRTSVHDKTEKSKESIIKVNDDFLHHEKKPISSSNSDDLRFKQKENIGAASNSDVNGPATSDFPTADSTKKATSKRRRFAGWFRKKVTSRTKLR